MKKFIKYFSRQPLFANFLMLAVFFGAVIFWQRTSKEEMPNITFDFLRVTASYPGASAQDTEEFVTNEIENALAGIQGIKTVSSGTTVGNANVTVELVANNPERAGTIQDIKDAMDRLGLPTDIQDTVSVREFKSSNRSILDIMLSYKNSDVLDQKQRKTLQDLTDILGERLNRLTVVSDINTSYYLDDKIEILVKPEKLREYEISFTDIINAIKKNNIKQPLGVLTDIDETKVSLQANLLSTQDIKNVLIRSGFDGYPLYLKDVATVTRLFEDQASILKVNGNEAVWLNVVKTSDAGIIEAVDAVKKVISSFSASVLKDTDFTISLLDDQSASVRGRLNLIVSNGLLGFVLVITLLFLFLNFKSGFWVAMGVPFSFGFTMIFASLMGQTINNMTLAAIIIVMGMVVDDAIVVAENVSRLKSHGMKSGEAVVKGTSLVLIPIIASITTTCAAFVPLFFFQGRFGLMTKFIPPIIFLMLGGSFFEAIIILPSHLKHNFPRWVRVIFSLGTLLIIEKYYRWKKQKQKHENPLKKVPKHHHWFFFIEDIYGKFLELALPFKWIFLIIFVALFFYSANVFKTMKYVLFPNEETTRVIIFGTTSDGMKKYATEQKVREVEEILDPYLGQEVVGYRTNIARGRRGAEQTENRFSINIELVTKEHRQKSTNDLIKIWQAQLKNFTDYKELSVTKSFFGQSSGSPIDVAIKESDDEIRNAVAAVVYQAMLKVPALLNAEIERIPTDKEIIVGINKALAGKLEISPETINSTLRTVLTGQNVFDITENDKVIEVILKLDPEYAKKIQSVLQVPVQNSSGYLVPISKLVTSQEVKRPRVINHQDNKRILHVYADLREKGLAAANAQPPATAAQDLPQIMTPLEIAAYFEANVFPDLTNRYPSAEIGFEGEIKDTRESGNELQNAIIVVIILIYVILALALKSLFKPFVIMLSIPFGFIGIILAWQAHGISVYGFFSVVGALGLAGVVVNDAIVMLDKLERDFRKNKNSTEKISKRVARIAKTRLRAVILTTVTTVAGLLPTAYGVFGYDSMLAEMMLTLAWGLIFGTVITLILIPSLYCFIQEVHHLFTSPRRKEN